MMASSLIALNLSKPRHERSGAAPGGSLLRVVGRLSAANWLLVAIGFITGPLQARALGPAGRGTLAAILLPLTFAPIVLGVGLGTFATREAARARPLGSITGSVGVLLVGIGCLAAAFGPLIAGVFAGGRHVVDTWVTIGFLVMPVSMASLYLLDIATGLQEWRVVYRARVIPPVVSLLGVVGLYATGTLTVETAALVSLCGGLLAIIPAYRLMRRIGRPRFERPLAGAGVRFGAKAWLGGLGSLANVRLDQILMTRLVAPRELGLYVVAVTVSGFFVSPFLGALTGAIMPRFAEGNHALAGRLLRTTLLGVIVIGGMVAIATPVVLPFVYGGSFSGAVPMAWLLILGSIPLAGVSVLSTVLTISGHPGFSAVSELIAVCITVPLLIIFLPRYGGMGAACVSAVAYTANLAILVFGARRHLGLSVRELLITDRDDFRMMSRAGLAACRKFAPRLAT